MLLLPATDGNWYTTYLIAMTLSVLEGRFPIVSLFMYDFSYFIHLALPFVLVLTGEDGNFKFGTDVDRSNS